MFRYFLSKTWYTSLWLIPWENDHLIWLPEHKYSPGKNFANCRVPWICCCICIRPLECHGRNYMNDLTRKLDMAPYILFVYFRLRIRFKRGTSRWCTLYMLYIFHCIIYIFLSRRHIIGSLIFHRTGTPPDRFEKSRRRLQSPFPSRRLIVARFCAK